MIEWLPYARLPLSLVAFALASLLSWIFWPRTNDPVFYALAGYWSISALVYGGIVVFEGIFLDVHLPPWYGPWRRFAITFVQTAGMAWLVVAALRRRR